MLTRIEINGFKTFESFGVDLGPFTVVLGPNAAGKSNLFDAIQLMARLAQTGDLYSAVKDLRGDPDELFRRDHLGVPGHKIEIAVEVLLDPVVEDAWGAREALGHTRLRYEIAIERRRDEKGIARLYVASEDARPILAKDDTWRPYGHDASPAFRRAYLKYSRRVDFLTTENEDGRVVFRIHQDGRQGRTRPAEAAQATVLSSIESTEFRHLFALREEMRNWRFLQLDPASLRRPSPTVASDTLDPDGANLATVLARLRAETVTAERPRGVLADISADLAAIVPGAPAVDVEEDDRQREYRAVVALRDEPPFSASVVSDGTLRVLALLAMLHSPRHRGLVCFEEPENGIHPERLGRLVTRLEELVTDPTRADADADEPLTQMLLNSHSPVVLAHLPDSRVLFADLVTVAVPGATRATTRTRVRRVRQSDQASLGLSSDNGHVTSFDVGRYLSTAQRDA